MVTSDQKMQFLNGLCDELTGHAFLGSYSKEKDLHSDVVEVVEGFRRTVPYGAGMSVWDADEYRDIVETINAFGRESRPDVCVNSDGASFIAIEVKLLREYYGLQRGIGQAVVNSVAYEYGIVFALDKREPTPGKHVFDQRLRDSLWNNHRIRIVIRD